LSLPHIKAGSEIFIRTKVYDNRQEPPVLYSPATSVKLTLTDPLGAVQVNDQAMTLVTTGTYKYAYQSSTSSAKGVWVASIKSTDGSSIVITEDADVCLLI